MTSTLNTKATAALLAHLEDQHAKIGTTIEFLRTLVGHDHGNGAAPLPTKDTEKDAEQIVAKARARFAAHKRAAVTGPRRSPEQWEAAIVRLLAGAGKPLSALDIGEAISPHSNTHYTHINRALKRHVIVQSGTVPAANGHDIPAYVLTARRVKVAKAPKGKKPQSKNAHTMRARSAALLAKYDLHEPRPYTGSAGQVGSLVRYGYLKQSGEGYVRTGKEYAVDL